MHRIRPEKLHFLKMLLQNDFGKIPPRCYPVFAHAIAKDCDITGYEFSLVSNTGVIDVRDINVSGERVFECFCPNGA